MLVGDAVRVRQVMTNLVGNAVKFTERGRIEVSVECPAWTATDAMMRVEVKDTGIGIAPDKLELIFEKFTQADGSMTRRYGGTGLGLTIVKQLVDLMGGAIGVKSELGQGSIFAVTFRLPLAVNRGSAGRGSGTGPEFDRGLIYGRSNIDFGDPRRVGGDSVACSGGELRFHCPDDGERRRHVHRTSAIRRTGPGVDRRVPGHVLSDAKAGIALVRLWRGAGSSGALLLLRRLRSGP